MKVLAIKNRRLGDTILWTASLEALQQQLPHLELDLICPSPYTSLFSVDPRVHRTFSVPKGWWETLRFLRERRREKYDLVLAFHASSRTARWAKWIGGREVLIHHHGRGGGSWGSDRPIVGAGQVSSAIDRDLNLVRTLGWSKPTPPTVLHVPQQWVDTASQRLSKLRHDRKWIVMGLGASRPAKQWPLERFIALAGLLHEQYEVIAVHENEAVFTDRTQRNKLEAVCTLVHTRSLSDLIGVLSLAEVCVGNDSGAKHLAAAIGRKTVTLFGPESVGEWHGYDRTRHPVVRREVLCRTKDPEPPEFSWCGVDTCPLSSHACLQTISAEEVADAVCSVATSV